MKINKKNAKSLLLGWEMLKEFNKNSKNKVTMDNFINTYFETVKENKNCDKCINKCKCCD